MSDFNYILYHHPSSICSIMVRYCYALRGQVTSEPEPIRIKEEVIDIFHEEQLSEHYLCDINALGEVPVLAESPLRPGNTIPDSLAITLYLANQYPNMIPEQHHMTITELLQELHKINYYALTFTDRPQTGRKIQAAIHQRLSTQPSQRYADALNRKLEHNKLNKDDALSPDMVEQNHKRATELLSKLKSHLVDSSTGWLFGLDQPSALDAHLIVFLVRMQDVDRNDLVPEAFKSYVMRAKESITWNHIQKGSTKPA